MQLPKNSLLPSHKLRWVVIGLVIAMIVWRGLAGWMSMWNSYVDVYDDGSAPYAQAVRVEPGASYFFTWGVTASPRGKIIGQQGLEETDRFGDTYTQAHSVLATLTDDLQSVGLTLRDVVNVRAYIVGDAETPPDFAGWNRAFNEFFGKAGLQHKPARTSVGISRLFISQYLIEVEFVAVFPKGRGPFTEGSLPNRQYEREGRQETHPGWRSYGRPRFPMSTGKAVEGGHAFFFSSQILPKPANPMMPPRMWMYGRVDAQAKSILDEGVKILSKAGLDYSDIFFVRTIVFPLPGSLIGQDFAVFNREYLRHFNNPNNPNQPTRTVMSAPGYNFRKLNLGVEMYGLYQETPEFLANGELVKAFPREGGGSDGVAVAADAGLLWLSGIIAPNPEQSVEDEARAVMDLLKKRLESLDSSLDSTVHLRVYLTDGGKPEQMITAWETVYKEIFPEGSAHEPALTVLPIVALPLGARVEVEVLSAWR